MDWRGGGAFGELVVREARDGHVEVISNGVFLMDTRDGRSERGLATEAVAAASGDALHVLVAGLGVGFSVGAALAERRVAQVTVVEVEPAVVELVRDVTAERSGADLGRVDLVVGDVHDLAVAGRLPAVDVVCLDVDNGPDWTVGPRNDRLYDGAGLDAVVDLVRPEGVLAVWSAHDAPGFVDRLEARFTTVRACTWDVARGEPDRVWVASGAR